ncbi:MAG: glycerol kinase GlpK [Thermoplasmata archaeon]|nr:glycerol kinase GlpK [Thermoplasmata archaeon]
MKYVMALDCGTTGIRAIIFDKECNIVSKAYAPLTQIFPFPGYCEQDAEEIWRKCVDVMKKSLANAKLKAGDIEAIGITTQRSTSVIWDIDGKPLHNAITWQDTRAANICSKMDRHMKIRMVRGIGKIAQAIKPLHRSVAGAKLVTAANLSFNPASSLAHLKWLLDNVGGAREKARKGELLFGTVDTWLVWKLTGGRVHATDYSNASATALYDPFSLKWNKMFLNLFDIPEGILPEVRETAGEFGTTKVLGEEIEIKSVVADQQAALFGEGCFKPGEVKCTHGTGSFIDMNVGGKARASRHKLLPFIAWRINGKTSYMLEGMANTTGAAIQWLVENLGIIGSVEESEEMASSVESSEGVYFVPAFSGLTTPYWDAHARGIVIGLSRKTRKEHIVRAVLEGIVYRCKDIMAAMEKDAGIKIKIVRANGGAARNNFLLQFMADMLNVRVERQRVSEVSALGAAFMAGLASGYWESREELIEKREVEKIFEPKMEEKRRQYMYEKWRKAVKRAFAWHEE